MGTQQSTLKFAPAGMNVPTIRIVPLTAPVRWLGAGWRDFRRTLAVSLPYGIVFALLGYGLVQWAWARPHLAMALTSGFLFVGPVLATVFYELSHRLEHHHQAPAFWTPLLVWRRNPASLGLFALMLVFVLSAWERISAILVGLFLQGSGIASVGDLIGPAILAHPDFLAAYFAFGGLLAAMVFSLSVVSLPMLLHRKVDFATAIVTSFLATRANIVPLLVWAAIIAAAIAIGFATDFIAMAVIFPWLGHASWHAYRDLVA
jgi:uncharacterized membrane protein